MSDYIYNKKYKELVEQENVLGKEILKFLNSLPDNEDIVRKFEAVIEIHEKKIEIIDDGLNDLEWDKDNEIDEKDSEIKDLERKVEDMEDQLENLEDQLENLGVGGSGNSLDDVMKLELWQVAKDKFTLTQLEEKFGGSKWQIM
jgi:predicted RNase H-like nuclease (RuvC/YqgF family)